MKFTNKIFYLLIIVLAIGIQACKDNDNVNPNLYLNGETEMKITLNNKYEEPGATAFDNKDGDITSEIIIVNDIDTMEENGYIEDVFLHQGVTTQIGTYVIKYSVKDKAGNKTTAERTVEVANTIQRFAIEYNVTKEEITKNTAEESYTTELEAHESLNGRIWFPDFANITEYSLKVYAIIRNDSIFIPLQTFPEDGNYIIQGYVPSLGGFAGMLNSNLYKLDITYNLSTTTTPNQVFHEVFTKLGK